MGTYSGMKGAGGSKMSRRFRRIVGGNRGWGDYLNG